MIKSHFLIFLIIIFISSKLSLTETILEYDVETDFDEDTHEFNFYYEEQETTHIIVIIKQDSILKYSYQCTSTEGNGNLNGNNGFLIKLAQGESCNIKIFSSSDVFKIKGKIWIHDVNKEIDIDFKQNSYGIDTLVNSDEQCSPIVYSVSNLEKDITAKFSYSSTMITLDDKQFTLSNPLTICNENDCQKDLKQYKFIKGQKYKIKASFEELKSSQRTQYTLNSFKISKTSDDQDDKGGNDTNLSFKIKMSLISLIILFML